MDDLAFRVGIDAGTTLTGLWACASDGRCTVIKVPSGEDVAATVTDALRQVADAFGIELGELCSRIDRLAHTTTTGLAELASGTGARTAVITTEGFGDTLEIGSMRRQTAGLVGLELGDYLRRSRRPPLVPRRLVAEVPERVTRDGAVVHGLDEDLVRDVLKQLVEDEVESVAICTLWSVADPRHERRLRELVAEALPEAEVSLSSEVAPVVGEDVRMTTTAVNAVLGPVLRRQAEQLEAALAEAGMRTPLLAGTSLGGVLPVAALADRPVVGLQAGPAAAVTAARVVGELLGRRDLIVVDAGGESVDVGLVLDGAPVLRPRHEVGALELAVPSVEVRSIAGGGASVAAVRDGMLEVGPASAGARPGPACFGRGGTEPTLTDADLLLGTLDPEHFAGGRMTLDRQAAQRAVSERVAEPLGLEPMVAAWGIRELYAAQTAERLRLVTAEHRRGARDLTLIVAGGLGPSHGWLICRQLGMDSFLVPPSAAALSACGVAVADRRAAVEHAAYLRIRPGVLPREEDLAGLRAAAEEAGRQAAAALAGAPEPVDMRLERSLAMRYRGQARQLMVPLGDDQLDAATFPMVLDRFELQHAARFGPEAALPGAGFEVLSVLADATGELSGFLPHGEGRPLERLGTRAVVFDEPHRPLATPVFATELPTVGQSVQGPCLVHLPGCTVVVPPGARATADGEGNLHVRLAVTDPPKRGAVPAGEREAGPGRPEAAADPDERPASRLPDRDLGSGGRSTP
ncbi:MAG TPA: hydantoinase/oxoprolinase family protein [Actinomycetes bacterium]|nr:hydantoinase/oxoprolinase family protein [Actinomycetes bacterium]